MICDFCSEQQPIVAFEYPCEDFDVVLREHATHPAGMHMNSSWLACKECSELIEAGELRELALRQIAARDDLPEDPEFQADLIGLLVQTYMRFQSLRTGPRRALQTV